MSPSSDRQLDGSDGRQILRFHSDETAVHGEVNAIADLGAFLATYPGVDFPFASSEPRLACPPLSPANSGELVERLGRAIDSVVGRHEVHAVPYGTDASTLAGAGIPAVVFGPGDIARAHTCDEWVPLDEVEQASEVLYRLARGR